MSHRVLSEHRGYLADAVRNAAYETALAKVCADAVVLDLGCGTGVWGLVALRHGARHVYAIEATGMIDWAKAVAQSNGVHDRITYLRGWSKDIELPERVDVVVSDQIGQFILEGGGIDAAADATRRFLTPGGTLIPGRIDYWVALGRSPLADEQLRFWSSQPLGLDFAALRKMAVGTRWYESIDRSRFVSDPVLAGTVEPAQLDRNVVRLQAVDILEEEGSANALFGWWEAELVPGITISNGPASPSRIDRDGVALPLFPELTWTEKTRCEIEVVARIGSKVLQWTVHTDDSKRASNTVSGSLGGIEDHRAAGQVRAR